MIIVEALRRPRRKITGMSALLLPFHAAGSAAAKRNVLLTEAVR